MKVLFAVITAGRIEERFMASFVEALMTYTRVRPKDEVYFQIFGGFMTHVARNKAIELAIKEDLDYIVMCDDDMVLKADTLVNLVAREKDLVAAAANKKRPDFELCAWVEDDNGYFHEFVQPEKASLYPVDAVGFGVVAIKVDSLKQVTAPYCETTAHGGEDVGLCRKFTKAGLEVYVDTENSVGHIGRLVVENGIPVVQ